MRKKRYGILGMVCRAFAVAPVALTLNFATCILAGCAPLLRTLATAFFVDTAVNVVAKTAAMDAVTLPILCVAGVVAVDWLLGNAGKLCKSRIELELRRKLRTEFTEKCARLEYRHIEDPKTWDLITKVTKEPEIEISWGLQCLNSGITLAMTVAGVIGLIAVNVWWAAIVTVAFAVPLMFLAIKAGKENYQAQRDTEREKRMQNYLTETLSSREAAEERAMFGYEPAMKLKFRDAFKRAFKVEFRTEAKWFFSMKLSSVLFSLISILIALTLIFPTVRGDITIGLFMSLVAAAFSLVQAMSWQFTEVVDTLTQKREYMKDVKAFEELSETSGATDLPAYPPAKFESLEIKNLVFTYPGTENKVIDGLNLKIKAGEHIAFVGVNGAGKTTLIKLLCALYTNYEGEILINGKELRTYTQSEIKSLFAVVFQDFVRYEMSLGRNVTADIPGRDPDAARKLGIDLPPETELGKLTDKGAELSGGQWQRVAIARALANPAPVRILDEPTSALDPIAESEVYERFKENSRGVTTLFISHRLGSTKLADRICVISGGHIIEEGGHQALMDKGGVYAEMFDAQKEWYR